MLSAFSTNMKPADLEGSRKEAASADVKPFELGVSRRVAALAKS